MAPEVVACKNYGFPADVYSYSVVMWEVFSGKIAYETMDYNRHFEEVVMKGMRPSLKIPGIPLSVIDSTRSMWDHEVKQRPNFNDICQMLKHDSKLLRYDRIQQSSSYSRIISRINRRHQNQNHNINGNSKSNSSSDKNNHQPHTTLVGHHHHLSNRTNYLMGQSSRSMNETTAIITEE
jgi:hypothetical protein